MLMAVATKAKTSKKTTSKKATTKSKKRATPKKNLVIVESPAKAKTIEKYLGRSYKVVASVGHIRDLKKSSMSIDFENNYFCRKIYRENARKNIRNSIAHHSL